MIHKDIPLNERIIFALDVNSLKEAKEWVERLETHIKFFKVGLQLMFAEEGLFPVINMIKDRGHKIMCDMKIFDVPETVKLALGQLKNSGVTFATVHGNDPILKAAVKEKNGVKILAVTLLTSFDTNEMKKMGLTCNIEDFVYERAKRAMEIGCDGVISSGLEASRLREGLGNNILIVTPGIRPGKNIDEIKDDDQKRISTAKDAIRNGADHIVVGRPISTHKEDSIAVVETMQKEIKEALEDQTTA